MPNDPSVPADKAPDQRQQRNDRSTAESNLETASSATPQRESPLRSESSEASLQAEDRCARSAADTSCEISENSAAAIGTDRSAESVPRDSSGEIALVGRLAELVWLFFRIGATSFGGPAVYIAVMEDEAVRRRGWLTPQRFADLVGATNLIPGPNATEVALHIGYQRAGMLGMLATAIAYITPSAVISGLLAWGYVRYGMLPAVAPLLDGIKPAVIAILVGALWRLLPSVMRGAQQWAIAVGVVIAALAGCAEVPTFFVAAGVGTLLIYATGGLKQTGSGRGNNDRTPPSETGGAPASWAIAVATAAMIGDKGRVAGERSVEAATVPTVAAAQAIATAGTSAHAAAVAAATAATGVAAVSVGQVWWFFLKIGAILYGSGYVIAAYIEGELTAPPWNLTAQQVLDALAAGQITPGPFVSTAGFVGYLLCGWSGVLAATAAINMPALVLVALTHRWIERCRNWRWTAGVLDAVNAAALGLMASVCLKLGSTVLTGIAPGAVFVAAMVASLRWRVGPVWLVLFGAVAGALLFR